jgi:hypothetical protein
VILSIKNLSTSQRLLDSEHIVAQFADGERRNPENIKRRFFGSEEVTMTINFGVSKFPILRVDMRN